MRAAPAQRRTQGHELPVNDLARAGGGRGGAGRRDRRDHLVDRLADGLVGDQEQKVLREEHANHATGYLGLNTLEACGMCPARRVQNGSPGDH